MVESDASSNFNEDGSDGENIEDLNEYMDLREKMDVMIKESNKRNREWHKILDDQKKEIVKAKNNLKMLMKKRKEKKEEYFKFKKKTCADFLDKYVKFRDIKKKLNNNLDLK